MHRAAHSTMSIQLSTSSVDLTMRISKSSLLSPDLHAAKDAAASSGLNSLIAAATETMQQVTRWDCFNMSGDEMVKVHHQE